MFKVGQVYRMIPFVGMGSALRYKVLGIEGDKLVLRVLNESDRVTRWYISDCEKDILDAEYTVKQILDKCSK